MSDASPPPWSKSELLAIQATGRHSHFDQASVVEGLPVGVQCVVIAHRSVAQARFAAL